MFIDPKLLEEAEMAVKQAKKGTQKIILKKFKAIVYEKENGILPKRSICLGTFELNNKEYSIYST